MADSHLLTSPSPPSPEPGTILLETRRLIIRRYLPSDAPAMAEAANDTAVAYNLRDRFPSPYTLADAESFIKSTLLPKTSYPGDAGIFIKPNTTGNPSDEPLFIGGIGIIPGKDVYFRTWELGYWLARPAWGQGYATEAAVKFVGWVFETWPGLNRLEANTYARNLRSQNVLRMCGFAKEGRRRGAVDKKGEIMDEVLFGLLRSDLDEL